MRVPNETLRSTLKHVYVAAFALAALTAGNAVSAGTLFTDTFEDRELTDGMPVSWSHTVDATRSFDASSGDLILTAAGARPASIGRLGDYSGLIWANSADSIYENIIVGSQVRFTEVRGERNFEDFVGLFVRRQEGENSEYWGGIRQDGVIASGITTRGMRLRGA